MDQPFSFATFLNVLEHDDYFSVDETAFYFDDDPAEEERMLGCLRKLDKPYWVGNCDLPKGGGYSTAAQLLSAKIFNGESLKDRWNHIVFVSVGGIRIDEWLDLYQDKL